MPRSDDIRVGGVARAVVRTAADAVAQTRDAALRDEPDGVHQHRTAVRRLRSVLAAFAPVLDRGVADRLRVEYAEWGRALGVVRDAEVRAELAARTLDEHGITDPAVRRRLVDAERAEHAALHERLVAVASSTRRRAADADLARFAQQPDVLDEGAPARPVLREILHGEVRRVRRRRVGRGADPARLHAQRKAGRRLRYVAEAVSRAAPDLFGPDLDTLAAAGEALHDLLGDHRDLVLFAARLEREHARAAHAGEPSTVYENLATAVRRDADKRLEDLDAAVDGARRAWPAVAR